jgi:hypothetical protein
VDGGDVAGRALQRRSHATIERCERSLSDIPRYFERLECYAVIFASHLEQRTITVTPNALQDVRCALSNVAVGRLRSLQKRVAILLRQLAQSRGISEQ